MSLKFVVRSFLRNKQRSFFLIIGILISVMLVTGVNTASGVMGTSLLEQNLRDVHVEFTVTTEETNHTKVLENLNQLESELEGYEGSFASLFIPNRDYSYIQKGPTIINWTILEYSPGYFHEKLNTTLMYGIEGLNFSESTRIEPIVSFGNHSADLTEDGVYISRETAEKFELEANDVISYGRHKTYYNDSGYQISCTGQVNNLTILGIFNILDQDVFHGLFRNDDYPWINLGDNVFIGNIEMVTEIDSNITTQIESKVPIDAYTYDYGYESEGGIFYGIFIDHSVLNLMNINSLTSQLTTYENRIKINSGSIQYEIESPISNVIQFIREEMALYQTLFIVVSIPVIMLGWFLCKTNYMLSYHNRRKEIALLKCKGGTTKKLRGNYLLEAFFIGVFGGGLGVIGGQLSAQLILKQIYPQALGNYTLLGALNVSSFALGLGLGIATSMIAVIKPLKEFLSYQPVDGLQAYHEESQTALPVKKRDWFLLAIGILPFILTTFNLAESSGNPIFVVFSGLATALLPLSPFLITYAVVKLVSASKKLFETIIKGLSKLFGKKYSVLAYKNILQNRRRSYRLAFIVAMGLSFMLMAATIKETEIQFQSDITVLSSGNGIRIEYYPGYDSDLRINNYTSVIADTELNTSIDEIGYTFQYSGGRIENEEYNYDNFGFISDAPVGTEIHAITIDNITKHIDFKDRWFESDSADAILDKWKTTANSTIIPSNFAALGYYVNDVISVEYYDSENFQTNTMNLTIVGIYKVFPLIDRDNFYAKLLVDNSTIPDGQFYKISMVVYPKSGPAGENLTYELVEDQLLSNISEQYSSAYNPIAYLEESTNLIYATVNFLDLETYYLLTIVTFAIGFIMYISITEKSRDFGVLRARGVEKKQIFKIQLAEGTILLIFGGLISLIGLLGAQSFVLNLNTVTFFEAVDRELVVPWAKLLIQIGGTLALFVASIAISVAAEMKKSDIGPIAEILRV